MSEVIIVDYGMGNIKSVYRGLEYSGASVSVSSDPDAIATASRVVLPGVGAFEDGMKGLNQKEIVPALSEFVKTGNPFMGICLGMQMLLDVSEENGRHQGLGFIQGAVEKIPHKDASGEVKRKIPHIGWSALRAHGDEQKWQDSCLNSISQGEFFYFVHSYMVVVADKKFLVAECEYEGQKIPAVIKSENVTGLQFHPEKSGEIGLKMLGEFVSGR